MMPTGSSPKPQVLGISDFVLTASDDSFLLQAAIDKSKKGSRYSCSFDSN
jgi:hypothetical protein